MLITLLFSLGAACFGHLLVRRLTFALDPAVQIGIAGLIGLGAIGTLTLFIGLVPGGLGNLGIAIVACVCGISLAVLSRGLKNVQRFKAPKGLELLFPAAIALAILFATVRVLAPSDTMEWDTLAYHLAVPKLWLQAGQIQPISYIHHSNFPFAVDNLYIWGLAWGGEEGAKAFTLAFHTYGIFAVFGFARQVYGELAGWWAALTWATIPAVLWLSGTGYIDVQNGLFAGLGVLFAALYVKEQAPRFAWQSGIMLGLAAGSKYTGLQTIFAVGLVLVIAALVVRRRKRLASAPPQEESEQGSGLQPVRSLLIVCGLALLISSPWYVKNKLWEGNPVYPFFYKQLGGKHWSDWQAAIYQNEQQSFGVARPPGENYTAGPIQPQRFGHAILGLAYQPGRYINPGQTSGRGFPTGAIGFAVIGSMLFWLISRRASPFESAVLGTVLLSFAMWFVLSEQSRYIIALGVPLSVLAGGAVTRLRAGPALAAGIIVQALFSFYLLKTFTMDGETARFDQQMRVAIGKMSTSEYLRHTTSFFEPAEYLNEVAKGGRVALYDEVFGFMLDVPYLWANPGHSNELGYDRMQTADDLIRALKAERINFVYVNLGSSAGSPDFDRWLLTLGVGAPARPYTEEEKKNKDLDWKAKQLLGEAIASRKLVFRRAFGRGIAPGIQARLVFSIP